MFKLLKTVFKAGDVTTKYPFKPYEVDEDFRGKPELNSDQCIVCAACTIACPANALTMRTDPVTGERTWSYSLVVVFSAVVARRFVQLRRFDYHKILNYQ